MARIPPASPRHPRAGTVRRSRSGPCRPTTPPWQGRSRRTSSLRCLRIHPEDFPMMAVKVVEAPAVHEAVVLWLHRMPPAGGDGLVHQFVHLRSALAGEAEEALGVLAGVAQLVRGEGLK